MWKILKISISKVLVLVLVKIQNTINTISIKTKQRFRSEKHNVFTE